MKLRIHDLYRFGQPFDIDWPDGWPLPRRGELLILPEGGFTVRDVHYFLDRAEPLIGLEVGAWQGNELGEETRTRAFSHWFPGGRADRCEEGSLEEQTRDA